MQELGTRLGTYIDSRYCFKCEAHTSHYNGADCRECITRDAAVLKAKSRRESIFKKVRRASTPDRLKRRK